MTNQNIIEIINQYNDRDSLYGDGLTNHLNMGLFALYKIGAKEEVIRNFAETYIQKNQLPILSEPKFKITKDNFKDYIGVDGSYSSFIPFFKSIFTGNNIDEVVGHYLNILIDGEAGGAFHGLIRLAYAYELKDPDEMAKALAYFSECYDPFEIASNNRYIPVVDPMETIQKLSEDEHFKRKVFQRPLIIGRMKDIYEDEHFMDLCRDIDDDLCHAENFSKLLLKIYTLTEDFTILHGFTSTHALRILSHLFDDERKVLKQHYRLLQLAYLSTNCTTLREMPKAEKLLTWEEIFIEVRKTMDVHSIKLIYSLSEQSKWLKDDLAYRMVAQRKVE